MKTTDFLRLVAQPGRTNYFVVCSDDLGLGTFLQGALGPIASADDVIFYDAADITKEKARQIEQEARYAPRGGSQLNHFFVYGTQKIPADSVGPLLKAVEEARFTRFIFQAQSTPKKIHTFMSRCSVAHLPFLTKKTVLGNIRVSNLDARTADQLDLYDGTLAGTIRALSMKDSMIEIRREMTRGLRGIAALFGPSVLQSLAFEPATDELFDDQEKAFLRRGTTDTQTEGPTQEETVAKGFLHDKRRIALYSALLRRPDQ